MRIERVHEECICSLNERDVPVGHAHRYDSIAIHIDQPVAAFRVRWYADGRWSGGIQPPQRTLDAESALLVGSMSGCWNDAVPKHVLERGAVFDITAIRHDGSEVPIAGLPHVLAFDDLAAARRPADRAGQILVAVVCAGGLVVLAACLRRRRRVAVSSGK